MLTDEIYHKSKEKILEIEKIGGAMRAIEAGFQQREIHETAWSHLTKVESGERKIVGINHGVLEEEEMPPLLKPDSELGNRQSKKLSSIRANRNDEDVKLALQAITSAAEGTDNLFPLVIDALRKNCTLGEIISAMKEVFGTYMAPSGF